MSLKGSGYTLADALKPLRKSGGMERENNALEFIIP
jgi:hypothetical protein